MKRTARHVAAAVLAGSVALGMSAAPAVAEGDRDGHSRHHDGDGDRHGDRHGRDRYDGDRHDEDRYDGGRYDDGRYDDRDEDRRAYRHRDRHEGHRWDGHDERKRDLEAYRAKLAGAQAERKAMKPRAERDDVEHEDGRAKRHDFDHDAAVEMQQRVLVAKLTRADAFLAGLAERLTESDTEASIKEPLLEAVAAYQARVADLRAAVESATTKEDLRTVHAQLRELGWEFIGEMVQARKSVV